MQLLISLFSSDPIRLKICHSKHSWLLLRNSKCKEKLFQTFRKTHRPPLYRRRVKKRRYAVPLECGPLIPCLQLSVFLVSVPVTCANVRYPVDPCSCFSAVLDFSIGSGGGTMHDPRWTHSDSLQNHCTEHCMC